MPTVPPEPVPQPRPEWPAVAARRPPAESAAKPTAEPATKPTAEPATKPTAETTGKPTAQTAGKLTAEPAAKPTAEPATKPTAQTAGKQTAESAERDRAAESDAPGGADWATLSATEAGWADAAEAGKNWTDPAAGPAGETSAGRPSPASPVNGASAGPARAPGAVLGEDLRDAAPAHAEPGAAATSASGPVSTGTTGADGPTSSRGPGTVARNTLIGPPPAPGQQSDPQVPPRGARVTWAAGVRSGAMRMGALRPAGARRGGRRPAGPPDGTADQPRPIGTEPDGEPGSGWEFLATAGAAAGQAGQVVVGFVRRHPLEAVAVVLLGLGGLIYPPVWLMGALVAMLSKVWDIRDKWIGMGLPVFLVVVGIVVEVMLDGNHRDWTTYVRDAWVFAGHLSRILALLGAVYLAWRAERGPRNPTVPPWRRGGR
jgi:hypothetical protein